MCRAPAGPPPLATELTAAIVFAALAARLHPGATLAAAAWLATCGIALAWIDAAVHRLPDVLTAAAYAGTVALLLLAAAVTGHWRNLVQAACGGLLLGAFYLLLVLINPSGMGAGDAKLATSVGTLLGWSGWVILLRGAFAAFVLAGLYGAAMLTLRRASRRQRIAFGPFILLGALAAVTI